MYSSTTMCTPLSYMVLALHLCSSSFLKMDLLYWCIASSIFECLPLYSASPTNTVCVCIKYLCRWHNVDSRFIVKKSSNDVFLLLAILPRHRLHAFYSSFFSTDIIWGDSINRPTKDSFDSSSLSLASSPLNWDESIMCRWVKGHEGVWRGITRYNEVWRGDTRPNEASTRHATGYNEALRGWL